MHGTAMRITTGRARRGIGSLLPGQIYVVRPSPLGNPYLLGRDGNREEVITQYRRWFWAQLQLPSSPQERELKRLLAQAQSGELELLCWCAPCRAMRRWCDRRCSGWRWRKGPERQPPCWLRRRG
jgi:hypothetical protein